MSQVTLSGMHTPLEDRLLKVAEVSRLLGYSRATVYRLIGQGQLPFVKVAGTIRFRYQSLVQWMMDHETKARGCDGLENGTSKAPYDNTY